MYVFAPSASLGPITFPVSFALTSQLIQCNAHLMHILYGHKCIRVCYILWIFIVYLPQLSIKLSDKYY